MLVRRFAGVCAVMLAALALSSATPALAAKGDSWISIQLGGSVPTHDFNRAAETGLEAGVAGTYMKFAHQGVGLDVAYHVWADTDPSHRGLAITEAIQTTAYVLFDFRTSERTSTYAKAGAGLYWLKTRVFLLSGRDEERRREDFGYNVGAGVNFTITRMHQIGIGGTYHIIPTGHSTMTMATVSVNLMVGKSAR